MLLFCIIKNSLHRYNAVNYCIFEQKNKHKIEHEYRNEN